MFYKYDTKSTSGQTGETGYEFGGVLCRTLRYYLTKLSRTAEL